MQRRSPRQPSPHVSPQSHAPAPAVSVTRLRDNRALRSASDVVAPSEQELRKLALARADFDFIRRGAPLITNPEKRAAPAPVSRPRRLSTRSSSARHTRDARSRLDARSDRRTTRQSRPVSLPHAVSLARARLREPTRDRVALPSEESAAAVQRAADRAPRVADRPFA